MSPTVRPNYVNVSVQTDADADDHYWYPLPTQQIGKRRSYVSLGKRLLIRCQQDRERMEEHGRLSLTKTDPSSERSLSPGLRPPDNIAIEPKEEQLLSPFSDTVMPDATPIKRPQLESVQPNQPLQKQYPPDDEAPNRGQSQSPEIKPPPPPAAAHSAALPPTRDKLPNGFRSSDLRVQLPSTPQYAHDPTSAPPMTVATAPVIPRSAFTQTSNSYPPLFSGSASGVTQPSPVKKVSLGEYFSRRKTESQAIDKGTGGGVLPQQSITKSLASVNEELKNSSIEGNSMDISKKEEGNSVNGYQEPT